MRYKLSIVLILIVLILTSCNNNDNLSDNNSNDEFSLVRQSGELWLSYGLEAFENNKTTSDLSEFFSDSSNISFLTLYDHMFTYDNETSVKIAEDLFRFIYENYGADELLNIEKRSEYKTEYLHYLGAEYDYSRASDIEKLFAEMDFSSTDEYQYIISLKNATYYFKDFEDGTPSIYHRMLYYNTVALTELKDSINSLGLADYFDTNRNINYYMVFDGKPSRTVKEQNTYNIYISNVEDLTTQAVCLMDISKNDENIWLKEGIYKYLGIMQNKMPYISDIYFRYMLATKQNAFYDNTTPTAVRYKSIYSHYTESGGTIDDFDSFDIFLYIQAEAKSDFDVQSSQTLGDIYDKLYSKSDFEGADLTTSQAASLVSYLVDTYGVNKVLEAYSTNEVEKIFRKSFGAIYNDWLSDLGIE